MVNVVRGIQMKRIFTFLTLLALLAVPVSAMAAAAGDWELVGYVKLETWFDSNQVSKELTTNLNRSNALQPNSMGRFRMTAQYSRIGLKINGPETLGAKTKGYFEFDFNSAQDPLQSSSNSYIPRLRHASISRWIGRAAGSSLWASTGTFSTILNRKPSTTPHFKITASLAPTGLPRPG
jgi:hypothetical protein